MLNNYIEAAIKRAEYKKLEDGTWFGEIPGFPGVWANGEVLEVCRMELIEVLEEWLLLKIKDGDSLPIIDGVKISIEKVAG
ncbi:MAG: type II toxin-antitoxin system HicB family antitoxin [Calditrichaceae bacterium]|nr:type II toxin-antitoxin system HicB family antitoxin [Calditrichia bacterium]NUQ44357.1 type II toxin-antitoxin system HicB family antitoxin [Calditrichaceae bacterium]